MRLIFLFPILFLFHSAASCEAQQPATSELTQVKKVTGPFKFLNGLHGPESEAMLSKMRAFLWENLDDHQAAEVKATFYTLEGEPTEWTFSVDASSGHWCIRGEYVSTRYFGLKRGQKPQITKGTENYCDAQRVDVQTKVAVPRAEKRSPETYRLQLDLTRGMEL